MSLCVCVCMLRAGRPDAMSIMSPSAYKTARARLSACVAWRCVEKARNKSGDSKLSDVALNYRKTVGAAGGWRAATCLCIRVLCVFSIEKLKGSDVVTRSG